MASPSVQIGGKFSAADQGIFVLKQKLLAAGVHVSHPIGNRIHATIGGVSLSVDLKTLDISLFDLELDYLRKIGSSSLHIVHNTFGEHLGYVGESASIEIGYAMLKRKNVCLLYGPMCSASVPRTLATIINSRARNFHIHRLDLLKGAQLRERVVEISRRKIAYDLSSRETRIIRALVCGLLRAYRKAT